MKRDNRTRYFRISSNEILIEALARIFGVRNLNHIHSVKRLLESYCDLYREKRFDKEHNNSRVSIYSVFYTVRLIRKLSELKEPIQKQEPKINALNLCRIKFKAISVLRGRKLMFLKCLFLATLLAGSALFYLPSYEDVLLNLTIGFASATIMTTVNLIQPH